MKKMFLFITVVSALLSSCGGNTSNKSQSAEEAKNTQAMEQAEYIKPDVYETEDGPVKITLVGHGSLMIEFDGKITHIDPYSKVADYSKLPKADMILLTHEHADHLDTLAIDAIKKENTYFLMSKVCNDILGYGSVIENGQTVTDSGILPEIVAVPAYNIVNKKPDGEAYHPKGRGNGYVICLHNFAIYVAGDTENIPEMEELKNTIDVAFMPKNLPYTMTDDMFVDAARKVNPKVLYPYHFSEFDEAKMGESLKDTDIKIQVRPMSNK